MLQCSDKLVPPNQEQKSNHHWETTSFGGANPEYEFLSQKWVLVDAGGL